MSTVYVGKVQPSGVDGCGTLRSSRHGLGLLGVHSMSPCLVCPHGWSGSATAGVPRHAWPTNTSSQQHLRCRGKRRVAPPSGRKRSSWQISESLSLPSDSGPSHLCGHLCEVQVSMTIAYKRTTMARCDTTVTVERPVIYKVWAQQRHIFLNPPYIRAFHTIIGTYMEIYLYRHL